MTANATTATAPPVAFVHAKEPEEEEEEEAAAGHDSPNWGKSMSYSVLFGCTLLYSIIAEILVQTVDLVMENVAIDEKFLGLTLFALVPNITEFMNAISFALYGNIVLRQVHMTRANHPFCTVSPFVVEAHFFYIYV